MFSTPTLMSSASLPRVKGVDHSRIGEPVRIERVERGAGHGAPLADVACRQLEATGTRREAPVTLAVVARPIRDLTAQHGAGVRDLGVIERATQLEMRRARTAPPPGAPSPSDARRSSSGSR